MAELRNFIKNFNFEIEVNGRQQVIVQDVQEPTQEAEISEHGGANGPVKTPGRAMISELVITCLQRSDDRDAWFDTLYNRVQNRRTGTGSLWEDITQRIVVRKLAPNGRVVSVNEYLGCWLQKVEPGALSRTSSDNFNFVLTFVVNEKRVLL
jgi:hypothetical protein